MAQDAAQVFAMLNALRDGERMKLMMAGDSGVVFERGEADVVPTTTTTTTA
jgi:hypothetical protein